MLFYLKSKDHSPDPERLPKSGVHMRNGFISILSLMMIFACGVKKDKNNDNKESQTDDSGSDVESVGEKISTDSAQSGITILMADTPLPDCTDKNRGQTFYVTAESLFRFCDNSGAWTVIDLKGAKGDTGNTGLPSTPGANWTLYSGATKIGRVYDRPLDIGLTYGLEIPKAIYIDLAPNTYFLSTMSQIYSGTALEEYTNCSYFKSNDCSGVCYLPTLPQVSAGLPIPKVVGPTIYRSGGNITTVELHVFDLSQVTTDTFQSFKHGTSGGVCVEYWPNPQTMSAVAGYPYTLPNGIAYPIPSINFKAE